MANKKHGRDTVLASTMKLGNVGKQITKALGLDSRQFEHGDRVYVVLECSVGEISYPPVTGGVERQHTLDVELGTLADADVVVGTAVDDMRRRLAIRAAADAGEEPFDGMGEEGNV